MTGGEARPASLLVALARSLIDARPGVTGTWVFLCALDDGRLWLAMADLRADLRADLLPDARDHTRISPRPEPEALLSAADGTARAALEDRMLVTDIAGVVLGPGLDTSLVAGLGVPVEVLHPRVVGSDPGFQPGRRIPPGALRALAAGTAALLAASLALPPVMAHLFPPPPPAATVEAMIEPGSFTEACISGQQGWWPRRIGWNQTEAGCALEMADGMADGMALSLPRTGSPPGRPLVIWRSYHPDKTRNRVLAEEAGDRMIADWPHHHARIGPALVLFQVVPLPLVAAPGDSIRPDGTTLSGLQRAWADQPDAVTRAGGDFIVTASGRLSDLLTRAAQVSELAPVRLIRKPGRGGELTLRAPRRITLSAPPVQKRETP
ncbi:hypothetical protein [Ruegeria sp.]|uniref:hypothetical protein n=1 Tax=Ruegeria sp. TaxID=1879320 RepID=UPI003B00D321